VNKLGSCSLSRRIDLLSELCNLFFSLLEGTWRCLEHLQAPNNPASIFCFFLRGLTATASCARSIPTANAWPPESAEHSKIEWRQPDGFSWNISFIDFSFKGNPYSERVSMDARWKLALSLLSSRSFLTNSLLLFDMLWLLRDSVHSHHPPPPPPLPPPPPPPPPPPELSVSFLETAPLL